MHAAIELVAIWAIAFLTLGAAVVSLSVFCGYIQSDMELHSLGKEATIAGIASLIEATALWLIILFIPAMSRGMALRGMIIPIFIVGFIYRLAHLASWGFFEAGMLLAFQIGIALLVTCLFAGNIQAAVMVVVMFAIVLGVVAAFAKSLWG